jgi:hypothetical protein
LHVPSGNIQSVSNPIVAYDTQNGKVPLSGITYLFNAAYAPASGIVNSDGFMLADGSTVPDGYALSGWVTPNLVDGSYIEGSTSPSLANVGSNSKTLSAAEMPIHSHSMSGSGGIVLTALQIATSALAGWLQSGPWGNGSGGDIFANYKQASVSIGGSTGNAGSSSAFDLRSMRKQGIPLVRVN